MFFKRKLLRFFQGHLELTVCVCAPTTRNQILKLKTGLLKTNPFGFEGDVSYKNFVSLLVCEHPLDECYLNTCDRRDVKKVINFKALLQYVSRKGFRSAVKSTGV